MKPIPMRRLYAYGIIVLLTALITGAVAVRWGRSENVPAIQPDPRVEWVPFPGDGLVLVRDTMWVRLPDGTVILIPHLVKGRFD